MMYVLRNPQSLQTVIVTPTAWRSGRFAYWLHVAVIPCRSTPPRREWRRATE
jgi:hypothetical protein